MIRRIREIKPESHSEGKDGTREYRRRFSVETYDVGVRPGQIKEHELFPRRWEQHPEDPRAFCVSRTVDHGKGPKQFLGEAFYTTDVFSPIENPLERPAEIDWVSVEYAEARLTDLRGRPLVNTAGEPLEGILIESPGLVANITVNVPDKPVWFRRYINAVNGAAYFLDGESFPAGELRIKSLGCAPRRTEQGFTFRELKMELQSREGGWQRRVLNRGFYEIADEEPPDEEEESEESTPAPPSTKRVLRQIMVSDMPAPEPQLLTREGKHLVLVGEDGILDEAKFSEIHFIDFRVREERDFGVLPIRQ